MTSCPESTFPCSAHDFDWIKCSQLIFHTPGSCQQPSLALGISGLRMWHCKALWLPVHIRVACSFPTVPGTLAQQSLPLPPAGRISSGSGCLRCSSLTCTTTALARRATAPRWARHGCASSACTEVGGRAGRGLCCHPVTVGGQSWRGEMGSPGCSTGWGGSGSALLR